MRSFGGRGRKRSEAFRDRAVRSRRKELLRRLSIFAGTGVGLALLLDGILWLAAVTFTLAYAIVLGAVIGALCFVCDELQKENRYVRPLEAYHDSPTTRNPYADLYFLEYRLSWGSVDRQRYEQRVRPLLQRVATERLLQRHGADLHRDPDRCREIVSEDLWTLLISQGATQTKRPPTPREVERLVSAIEAI